MIKYYIQILNFILDLNVQKAVRLDAENLKMKPKHYTKNLG